MSGSAGKAVATPLTPASNHAEPTLAVKILLIREMSVLVHGRFELRLTDVCVHGWSCGGGGMVVRAGAV